MENDGDWSLADWAKIEWTARALDGNPPFEEYKSNNSTFEDRSFKWLLQELYSTTTNNDKNHIEIAMKGTDKLFDLLTSAKPGVSPEKITEIIKMIKQEVFTDFGLKQWKPNTDF